MLSVFCILYFPLVLYANSLNYQMNSDFDHFSDQQLQQQRFEQPNSDYTLPNGHHIRMESDEEEDDFFMKTPIIEHPFYQKPQSVPVYVPPQADYPQHRLIDDNYFGYVPQSDTAKCFSCMSKFYEAVWPALSHVYKKPLNFTDNCNDDMISQKLVPITHCPTICVAMSEESTVAGVKIKGYIRGCMDEILHNGFNQSIVHWFRWMHRDGCRTYRKRELFKLPIDQSDEGTIQVCTCYSDYCNSTSGILSRVQLSRILLLAVLGSLLLRI